MSAAGDIITYAQHSLPELVKLGRPMLMKLHRRASGRCAKARAALEQMSPLAPLHQFEAAQARLRQAAEAHVKYSEALRVLELSGSSNPGPVSGTSAPGPRRAT